MDIFGGTLSSVLGNYISKGSGGNNNNNSLQSLPNITNGFVQ